MHLGVNLSVLLFINESLFPLAEEMGADFEENVDEARQIQQVLCDDA
jgi:hypothetical protein